MSCHTSELLAWVLVLLVFMVLVIGLALTSIGEEVKARIGVALAAPPSRLWSAIRVDVELISVRFGR
jgi:hypothetical protein